MEARFGARGSAATAEADLEDDPCDLEPDADREPSLGAPENRDDQRAWASGDNGDCELDPTEPEARWLSQEERRAQAAARAGTMQALEKNSATKDRVRASAAVRFLVR